jgi:uncharacterized protein (TIGR02246 family)
MIRIATFIICLALACSAQTATIGNAAPLLDQSLVAQTQAVAQAQESKNGDTLKRLLTDDFQQVGSEGKLHDKDEFIGDAKDGKLTGATLYSFKVLAVDENAAIVTCDAVIHGTEGDNILVPHYQHLSFVRVKQAGQWRLRFQQATAKRPVD